jgi:hypothetical protein
MRTGPVAEHRNEIPCNLTGRHQAWPFAAIAEPFSEMHDRTDSLGGFSVDVGLPFADAPFVSNAGSSPALGEVCPRSA